jgi:peptide chain release factor subunit 1
MNEEEEVATWKTKKLLKSLKSAAGNGTSMVSIILRKGESIHKMAQKLTEEYGTAVNIQKRVNRQSVQSAITSAQQRLKLYNKTPPNGLAIFSGDVVGEDGKEKKMVIDFEPHRPVNTTMYLCDDKFHIEPLEELLEDNKKYAFIIVDGNGYYLAYLCGNTSTAVDRLEVDLPSKTRRGGQSSNRYARLRDQAKFEYLKKVCERVKQNLVVDDKVPVEGIIVAGNAELKNDLMNTPMLDPRVKNKIIPPVLDVGYGGYQGFKHAIALSKDTLGNQKFLQEKKLLEDYFEHIARDTGLITFAVRDTIAALEAGAVEYLILYENLEEKAVPHIPAEAGDTTESPLLIDWLVDNHKKYGAEIRFVSDCTAEGAQFVRGFGGIGAVLRYKMQLELLDEELYFEEDDDM